MDDSKKPLMIGIIVGCLALAGIITYWSSQEEDHLAGLEGETQLMRCRQCKEVFEMPLADYLKAIQEKTTGPQIPGLTCPKCGKNSAYAAIKCPNCGIVFEEGALGPTEPSDKCPECGKRAKFSRRTSQ